MILEGTITQVIGVRDGTSQAGKDWKLSTYLLETDGQYPKKVAVEVFGEERINELSLLVGEHVSLEVDVESREWNGKWFTSVRAWKRADEQAEQPVQPAPATPTPTTPQVEIAIVEETTDLPF